MEPGPEFAKIAALAEMLLGPARPSEWSDEHDRADLYHLAFDRPSTHAALWDAAAVEPEPSIKSSIVVQMIERVDPAEAEKWLGLYPTDYARRRASEMQTFCALAGGSHFDDQRLNEWSDWLQRRLSSRIERVDVLEALATRGRTRRVRAAASLALASLGE